MTWDYRENSAYPQPICIVHLLTPPTHSSVVEGTRESLDRLDLDYVDIIFAHCPDVTGSS
jgi:aryl-alcohol dehydrogenase-like predicted oxidoreductase